jgi:hypothetical protein
MLSNFTAPRDSFNGDGFPRTNPSEDVVHIVRLMNARARALGLEIQCCELAAIAPLKQA